MTETVGPDPFSTSAIKFFERGLTRLLCRDLGCTKSLAAALARRAAIELSSGREAALSTLTEIFEKAGTRASWNRVLRDQRSAVLGRWVAPYIRGTVLDLLCGDGAVGDWLSRHGRCVTLCEREKAYAKVDRNAHLGPFIGFEHLEARPAFDTVLLSTVLHHEPDLEKLLEVAAAVGLARLVIVENCIERDAPDDYQLLMDIFFNRSLNDFHVPAIARHRSAPGWLNELSAWGRPRLCDRRRHLPGIPLPHHLIVVDLSPTRDWTPSTRGTGRHPKNGGQDERRC